MEDYDESIFGFVRNHIALAASSLRAEAAKKGGNPFSTIPREYDSRHLLLKEILPILQADHKNMHHRELAQRVERMVVPLKVGHDR